MKVLIDRYDPETGESRTDSFTVDDALAGDMTVMSLLGYLAERCDPTIAYYHHSVCDHGICGRCLLQVNGKTALACITSIKGLEEVHLSPVPTRTCIRDLVTK